MISSLLRSAGAVITAAISIIVFYEGVPVARKLPFVGHLPVIGWIIEGEVGRRLEGYVTLSENAAAEAKASKEQHDRLAAQQALEEARRRAIAAEKLKDDAHAELEKRIAEDAADGADDGCGWSRDDDEWLRHH
jgi:hypothetical protein